MCIIILSRNQMCESLTTFMDFVNQLCVFRKNKTVYKEIFISHLCIFYLESRITKKVN